MDKVFQANRSALHNFVAAWDRRHSFENRSHQRVEPWLKVRPFEDAEAILGDPGGGNRADQFAWYRKFHMHFLSLSYLG